MAWKGCGVISDGGRVSSPSFHNTVGAEGRNTGWIQVQEYRYKVHKHSAAYSVPAISSMQVFIENCQSHDKGIIIIEELSLASWSPSRDYHFHHDHHRGIIISIMIIIEGWSFRWLFCVDYQQHASLGISRSGFILLQLMPTPTENTSNKINTFIDQSISIWLKCTKYWKFKWSKQVVKQKYFYDDRNSVGRRPQAKENTGPIISTGNSTSLSPLVRNSEAESYADTNVISPCHV